MAYDAGMLAVVLREISEACLGLRVEKIHQPTKDEVVLFMRGKKLSLNVGSVCPRISLTEISKDNPASPPMFCMLLRKHLAGARIVGVSQIGFDRIADLTVSAYDEMGYKTNRHIICEIMG